jgi:serine/threonine protein kinase
MSSFPIVARYRIQRELGHGAMGIVYEAEHTEMGRLVALKLLQPRLRGEKMAEARFAREARVAARLRHPQIVEVFDAGLCEVGPFLVMELVAGPTLAAHLRDTGALRVEEAVSIVLPVATALAHAHAHGVLHRDIKPANVLLARDHVGDRTTKLGDFGIGKLLEPADGGPLTNGGFVGSLPYVAPEQLRDAEASDYRADQYSLAVLLYEMCTGKTPFRGRSELALMEAICGGRAQPICDMVPAVPAALAATIARAMSLAPENRYPSVSAFGQELLRFGSGRCWSAWSHEFSSVGDGRPPVGATLVDAYPGSTGSGISAMQNRSAHSPWKNAPFAALSFCALSFCLGAMVEVADAPGPQAGGKECVVDHSSDPVASQAPTLEAVATNGKELILYAAVPPASTAEQTSVATAPFGTGGGERAALRGPHQSTTSRGNVEIGSNRAPILE